MCSDKVENRFLVKTLKKELEKHPEMADLYEPKIAENEVS